MEAIDMFIESCLEPSSSVLTRAIKIRNTLLVKHCLANGVTLSSKDVRIICAYRPEYFSLIDDEYVFTLEIIKDVIQISRHANIIKVLLQKCRQMNNNARKTVMKTIIKSDNDVAFHYFKDVFDTMFMDITTDFLVASPKIIDILIADKKTAILKRILEIMIESETFETPTYKAIMNYLPDEAIVDIFIGFTYQINTIDIFLKHPAITPDVIRRTIAELSTYSIYELPIMHLEEWLAQH
jgi:hypothetical protein